MTTKAFTIMRNDTENKKSRAGPFYANGLARFSLFAENVGAARVQVRTFGH